MYEIFFSNHFLPISGLDAHFPIIRLRYFYPWLFPPFEVCKLNEVASNAATMFPDDHFRPRCRKTRRSKLNGFVRRLRESIIGEGCVESGARTKRNPKALCVSIQRLPGEGSIIVLMRVWTQLARGSLRQTAGNTLIFSVCLTILRAHCLHGSSVTRFTPFG